MEDLFQYGNVFCYVSSWKTKSSVKKKNIKSNDGKFSSQEDSKKESKKTHESNTRTKFQNDFH